MQDQIASDAEQEAGESESSFNPDLDKLLTENSKLKYQVETLKRVRWGSFLYGVAEMPTSEDLKLGDCLFFHPPRNFNRPPRRIDPAPNGNDLGHYMKSYMIYILSKFDIIVLMLEIIFVNDWLSAKIPPETVCE